MDLGPPSWFDGATFARVSRPWNNPDWLEVTLHSYWSRLDVVPVDPRGAWLDAKMKATRTLSLPTMIVQGQAGRREPARRSRQLSEKFTGAFELVTLPDLGLFPQREAPDALSERLLAFLAEA